MKKVIDRVLMFEDENVVIDEGFNFKVLEYGEQVPDYIDPWAGRPVYRVKHVHYFDNREEAEEFAKSIENPYNPVDGAFVVPVEHFETREERAAKRKARKRTK